MDYTIKKIAKLAGITERTMRHYDIIGLLKPAYYGENGYRYYQEEQLLILQQILFFRELGFKLKDIKKVLYSDNCDKKNLLKFHKIFLRKKVSQIKTLIKTIDKTIAYLEGERLMMSGQEMFEGFFAKGGRGEIYATYFLENKLTTKEELIKAEKQIRTWGPEIWENIQKTTKTILEGLAYSMKNKFSNDSIHVQNIIAQHYKLTNSYLPLNRNAYIGLGKLYCENETLKNFFNGPKNPIDGKYMNEGLVKYLAGGMEIYAEKELTFKPHEPEKKHILKPA